MKRALGLMVIVASLVAVAVVVGAATAAPAKKQDSSLTGLLDNAVARREVLHVLVVNHRGDVTLPRAPALTDEALEAQLRGMGLHVSATKLDDGSLGQAVAYAASRLGPRVLICYGGGAPPAEDGAESFGPYGSDG